MQIWTVFLPALLATTAVEAKPPKDFDASYRFAVYLQRYRSEGCKDPIGTRRNHSGKRVAVEEGKCLYGNDNQKWASFDYKWKPFANYEADVAVDDPLLTDNKASPNGKRYCSLRFWENDNCEGPSNTNLVRANEWDKIEKCHEIYRDPQGSPGQALSMRLECRYGDKVTDHKE